MFMNIRERESKGHVIYILSPSPNPLPHVLIILIPVHLSIMCAKCNQHVVLSHEVSLHCTNQH